MRFLNSALSLSVRMMSWQLTEASSFSRSDGRNAVLVEVVVRIRRQSLVVRHHLLRLVIIIKVVACRNEVLDRLSNHRHDLLVDHLCFVHGVP